MRSFSEWLLTKNEQTIDQSTYNALYQAVDPSGNDNSSNPYKAYSTAPQNQKKVPPNFDVNKLMTIINNNAALKSRLLATMASNTAQKNMVIAPQAQGPAIGPTGAGGQY